MSETEVVKRALETVRAMEPGGLWWRQNSGRKGGIRFASINLPDIVGVRRFGMSGFVEVKTKTGRLSEEQPMFLIDMERRGAWCRVYIEDKLYRLADLPDRNMPPGRKK